MKFYDLAMEYLKDINVASSHSNWEKGLIIRFADWLDKKHTKQNIQTNKTMCTCTHDAYESIINLGHCDRCGKPIFRQNKTF